MPHRKLVLICLQEMCIAFAKKKTLKNNAYLWRCIRQEHGREVSVQADVVHWRAVGVEEPIVPLRRRARLKVLIKQREHVHIHGRGRPQRRALLHLDPLQQVPDVRPGVLRRGARLVGVPPRRPPRLRHLHLDVREPEPPDRRVHGVHLRVQHVVVPEPRPAVDHAGGVGLEQHVLQRHPRRVVLVREVRVAVDEERRPRRRQELQEWAEVVERRRGELPRRGRERRAHDVQGVRRGDVDAAAQAERVEGAVHGHHGREHGRLERRVVALEHLVAHGDAGDARPRAEVGDNVLLHPGLCCGGGGGDGRDGLVADAHHELHARAQERAEHVGVRVVELHLADPHGTEQPRHPRRGWEVVRDLPVVDADR
ncbi:unnamed protein product [Urochloa decumbens]|uniref:Uncharacterized protein n=1 Tax=Urochloa decumbens TaxID=240449 RepID=A0ABC9EJ86_9POAL